MKDILKNLKKNYIYGVAILFIIIIIILAIYLYKEKEKNTITVENQYNLAFFELIDYIEDVKNYLAKATISREAENTAETLMHVWREANLAQVYLAQLPISSAELSNTAKFLNQVSEYSYTLAKKSINGENLNQEELDNLNELYEYCNDLKSILNQLLEDMQKGNISWKELSKDTDLAFAQQVDNLSATSFSNLDENFGEFAGLIYDGAYSEHIENSEKKGLVGEEINEDEAKQIAIDFIGEDRIQEMSSNGLIENGNIKVYNFAAKLKEGDENNPLSISISQKGGHIVLMNYYRNVENVKLSQEEASKIGEKFLNEREIYNMESTYYIEKGGFMTINYAYVQDDVTIYADLIKLKIALDNGEIVGIETTGYLNNHTERNLETPKITLEEAKKNLNKNLEIESSGLAIIPTEWRTEVFCYEFKGFVGEMEFLVYINASNGKEENILLVLDTGNGVLTQ